MQREGWRSDVGQRCFSWCRLRQDGLEGRAKDESLLGGLRAAWQCKAYVMLNVTYLMTWLCFQILAANLILYLVRSPQLSPFSHLLSSLLWCGLAF